MNRRATGLLVALALCGMPVAAASPPTRDLVITADRTAYAEVRFDDAVLIGVLPEFSKTGSGNALVVEDADGAVVFSAMWGRVFDDAVTRAAAASSNPFGSAPRAGADTTFWGGGEMLRPGSYRFHLVTDAPARVRVSLEGLRRDTSARAAKASAARFYTRAFREPLTDSVGVHAVTIGNRNEYAVGVVASFNAHPGATALDLCVTPTTQRGCGVGVAGHGVGRATVTTGWGGHWHLRSFCGDQLGSGARHLTSVVRSTTPGNEGASMFVHLPAPYAVGECALPLLGELG